MNEAAISAMIIMITFQPWGTGFPLERFLEALIGGCTALAVNALLPINPERMVSTAAHPIFDESVAVLEETAAALDAGDFERACALVCFNRSRRGLWNRLLVQNTASPRCSALPPACMLYSLHAPGRLLCTPPHRRRSRKAWAEKMITGRTWRS